jgi:putative NIF3 family GTP cyclohydrolase 1 type 2
LLAPISPQPTFPAKRFSRRIGNSAQCREKSLSVGVLTDVAIIAAHDAIDSADEGGRAAQAIEILDHRNLVRDGTVKTDPTHRTGTAHGIAKCLWGHVTIEVTRINVVVFISSLRTPDPRWWWGAGRGTKMRLT